MVSSTDFLRASERATAIATYRISEAPTLEQRLDDVRAVMDHVGSRAIANSIMDIIARQGRQIFRKKQFKLYGGRRVGDRARQCKSPSRHGSLYPTPTSQIGRSSRGFQNGRNSSIFGQRFITTFRPAASASRAASSLRTPICIQTTLAPILMASSVTA